MTKTDFLLEKLKEALEIIDGLINQPASEEDRANVMAAAVGIMFDCQDNGLADLVPARNGANMKTPKRRNDPCQCEVCRRSRKLESTLRKIRYTARRSPRSPCRAIAALCDEVMG